MNKFILITGICIFTFKVIGQFYAEKKVIAGQNSSTYCAVLIDGKIMLMTEGMQIYNDVKLANGTVIKTDGTVKKKDNTNIILKNGDCIDQDGNIIPADKKKSENDKMKDDSKKDKKDY